jgi:ABC-type transport system substrate-binding protein
MDRITKPFFDVLLFIFFLAVFCLGLWSPAVFAANVIKIGIIEEPKSLNIWRAGDAWSNRVLGLIYQPLYIRSPKTLHMVPWLAETDPVYDADHLSYTVRLRPARWSDGTPFTAEDVAFTGDLIRSFMVPRHFSNWTFIRKIQVVDRQTVRFFLKEPKAVFLTRTLATPIVQKKEWAALSESAKNSGKGLIQLLNHQVRSPVGTGPFILGEWRQGAYVYLEKNPHFFGRDKEIEGLKLGPFIDGVILKLFGTTDTAILALKKGSIDMFWWGLQPGYLYGLRRDEGIKIFFSEKSGLYYVGFNLRKSPFNDIHFRHAVATILDKDFIVQRIMQRYAVKMKSIVPPGNRYWHCSDVPMYGEGLSRDERIRGAYRILKKGGYRWKRAPVNGSGDIVKGKGIMMPDGSPMDRFTILTPPADYDPHRAIIGILLQEWLRVLGMPAYARPMSFNALYQNVRRSRRFDLYILGYGNLSLDPDYVRNFFHSSQDRSGGWNASGYRNPLFDRIADESANTMDREKRRKLIWDMQRMVMRDIPYYPLYNPKLIEAVRTERFRGWISMMGGIGNAWSFCTLKPRPQRRP